MAASSGEPGRSHSVPGSGPDGAPGSAPDLVAVLRAAGCVFAEDEARLLREAADAGGDLEPLVARRVAGEPLEQVLGWAEFCGLRVRMAPGVFVPRRRTEALVGFAVEVVRLLARPAVVVDLCCGTGAVGIAVDHETPGVELHVADLDPNAVACARSNVTHGRVHEGDLYAALPDHLRGRVDLITVNAPYVPTGEVTRMPPEARDHEHRMALDGGADGLDVHRRVAAGAPEWLAPGGSLLIETSREQAQGTVGLCRGAGMRAYVRRRDETGSTVVHAISEDPDSSGTMSG